VTKKNFGRDRRYPIVNRFRDSGTAPFRPDEAVARAAGKVRVDLDV
jgi:NAD+ synthase